MIIKEKMHIHCKRFQGSSQIYHKGKEDENFKFNPNLP